MLIQVICLCIATAAYANSLGPPCLPQRVDYKTHYPCIEGESMFESCPDDYSGRQRLLRGEPSEFAQTGYYDKLFRTGNTKAQQGEFLYYPSYGYNANLPVNGPYFYRYSNFYAD